MPENLWGDLPEVEEVRTPAAILKEQATLLTEMTNGVLRGRTLFSQVLPGALNLELRIVAQALQGYEYGVLKVTHPIEQQYPLTLTADIGGKRDLRVNCANEPEFLEALKDVLTAERTRTVIASLLAQSKILGKSTAG